MADVVRAYLNEEIELLQEISDELDGILSMIAYCGKDQDLDFIVRSSRRIDKLYGARFSEITDHGSLGLAKSKIGNAWFDLDQFCDHEYRPENLREAAEDTLQTWLLRPDLDYDFTSSE